MKDQIRHTAIKKKKNLWKKRREIFAAKQNLLAESKILFSDNLLVIFGIILYKYKLWYNAEKKSSYMDRGAI